MRTLRAELAPFASAYNVRASIDFLVSLVGYAASLSAAIYLFTTGMWFGYAAAILLGAMFMVKIFTIQHDCGHDSMFSSPVANTWAGRLCSLITTMPFDAWKRNHAMHHQWFGNLSNKGVGDTALMTVEEYRNAHSIKLLGYHIVRNPFVHLVVSPFIYFFAMFKFIHVWMREYRASTIMNNLIVLFSFLALVWFFGFWPVLLSYVPTLYLGGIVGLTLFYLQHNFPTMKWFTSENWSHEKASLHSSSLIILPEPLEWFSHAIGFHHVHHLNSKVPGYRLRSAYNAIKDLRNIKPLSFSDTIRAFRLKLWSFDRDTLVTYDEAKDIAR